MDTTHDLQKKVLLAARDNGVSSVLFRNAVGRKMGLNIADSECLSLLSIQGVATPKELARYTGLTTGSTTAMLDRLEQAGYIVRKPNPQDRRGVLVETSEQYAHAVRPFVTGVQQAHHELLNRYSDEELKTIADFLTRFSGNVLDRTQAIEKM